ncbi:MAG: phosphoribosylamine--glycine ligase [Bacteroidota bacterium]
MKVLLIGGGGREHALAWKMAQSPLCENLYIAPGNPGTALVGTNIGMGVTDFPAIKSFVKEHKIDTVVVGPEQPLVEGIVEALSETNAFVVGPNQRAAALEGSKAYSKAFMQKYGVPTAAYQEFVSGEEEKAIAYLDGMKLPIVVKASGLAAGKGVLICEDKESAIEGIREMLSGESFGEAGKTIVVEEFLKGIEISIFVLINGDEYVILPSAKDYKRIGEGDTGLNTGGMGAVSPVPFADAAFLAKVEEEVIKPTMKGLKEENLDYRGFIFIGLMVVSDVPYVLEYNVRMGDPETEVVMPRLETDLLVLFEAMKSNSLSSQAIKIKPETCCTVMMVSGGYPQTYEKGKTITGIDQSVNSLIFHAGTKEEDGELKTNGGRVMAVSSYGESIEEAVHSSLKVIDHIEFEGKTFRKDIGKDLIS